MYKMRDEELVTLLQKKAEEEIEKIIRGGQKVEEGDDYVVMKVPKAAIDNYGKRKEEEPVQIGRREKLL